MPEDGPRTTAVMMTHNRRAEAARALERMTALPDRVPIIAVDNGSTDGTADLLAAEFPQVRLLRSTENLGAVARNLAVREVTTPYVSFCDDDCWWAPGSLRRAARVLDEHPAVGAVMGRCVVEPDGRDDPLTPELRGSPVPAPAWLPGPALLSVMAGLTTFRTSAFRAAGGFRERLWLGGEEELLALDLAAAGWWLCWVEDVVVHHAPSAARDSRRRRQLGIRNTLWTTWLRRPLPSAVRRSAAVLGSSPKDRHTLGAVSEAVGGLRWVLRERRVVPPGVERGLRRLEESQRRSAARRYVD
ncbi:glycosyltransferase family 2 protein [Saccharopolyspora cebuensis]|uniref:Glycosyltransferase family 2 protein n=1 Tax=Saccharopolyspora cebuensis TaxID=418759 RepID=A0ABV4CQ43_9PSEU